MKGKEKWKKKEQEKQHVLEVQFHTFFLWPSYMKSYVLRPDLQPLAGFEAGYSFYTLNVRYEIYAGRLS